jgi:hypothetical protein
MVDRSESSPEGTPFNLHEARFERRAIERSRSPLAKPNDTGLDITRHVFDLRARFNNILPDTREGVTDIPTRPLDELMGTWRDDRNSPEILDTVMHCNAHHPNTAKPASNTAFTWLLNWVKKLWK